MDEDGLGFYERALEEARNVSGADELEALRRRLLKALRRQPGEVRQLLRHAESLSRMAVAAGRMSPQKSKDLAERFRAMLESVGDQLLPEGWRPEAESWGSDTRSEEQERNL